MNLQQAIGYITESNGKAGLKKSNILEILENYGAFAESKASKFILQTVISEDVIDIIISETSDCDEIVSILMNNYGFDKDLSKSLVLQIINGLNTTGNNPSYVKVDNGSHMTFKGVPICGHIDTVRQKLESMGYTFNGYLDNAVLLNGEFAGKSGCEIYILGSVGTQQAWKIIVYFPEHKSWHSLKDEYFQYKEIFTNKYGKPESFEYFEHPYEDGDGYELTALYNEKCSFQSFFKTENGYITIAMKTSNCIAIDYEDNTGAEIATKERESKVNLDI
jgi:hypothetical protein